MTPAPRKRVLDGGSGWGPDVRGEAVVSLSDFGVRYDLDPETGVISNRQHDLYGCSVSGKVLVFANPKGGSAASWALANLVERGIAPVAIIFRDASPIFVQGSIFAGLSIVHRLAPDPCTNIRSGESCELFPSEGRVVVGPA
jgi:predicted aconitase with swiveling domain